METNLKTKKHVIILFLMMTAQILAQGVVEMPETNVLYKGYDNRIIPGFNGAFSSLILSSEDAFVYRDGETWIVRPFENRRSVTILVTDSVSNVVGEWQYRVPKLPEPDVFWGTSLGGYKISRDETRLFCRYQPFLMLEDSEFRIEEYMVCAKGRTFSSKGNVISEELSTWLKTLPSETEVHITLNAINKKGIRHEVDAYFTLE